MSSNNNIVNNLSNKEFREKNPGTTYNQCISAKQLRILFCYCYCNILNVPDMHPYNTYWSNCCQYKTNPQVHINESINVKYIRADGMCWSTCGCFWRCKSHCVFLCVHWSPHQSCTSSTTLHTSLWIGFTLTIGAWWLIIIILQHIVRASQYCKSQAPEVSCCGADIDRTYLVAINIGRNTN